MTQTAVAEQREFTPHSPPPGRAGAGRTPAEVLRAFADGFFEAAGPTLITVLNRPVTVAVVGVESVSVGELLARMPLPWIVVSMPYSRGLTGSHGLILSTQSAVSLGQALAGDEEGPASEFLPAHEEAIRETVNQILLSARATLTPVIGRSVTFGSAGVLVVEDAGSVPPEIFAAGDRLWLIRADATGAAGFHTELLMTVGAALAREITSLAEASEPPSAVEARSEATPSRLDLILDITLPVTVELGRTRMQIQDILKLAPGSVIELEKSAGDPVELFINDRPIAKGEVVVIDENFGVRLTSIVAPTERIKTLR